MRISKTKSNNRTQIKQDSSPKKKYFFVFEGIKTEPLYFETLFSIKKFDFKDDITYMPLYRLIGEDFSNPKRLLELLLIDLQDNITYNKLLTAIIDILYEKDYLAKRQFIIDEFQNLLYDFFKTSFEAELTDIVLDIDSTIQKIADYFRKDYPRICSLVTKNIKDALNANKLLYDSEIDTVCLVVDRDPNSFTSNQFDIVYKTCIKNSINLLISNPCFEFWLLLHFDEVNTIDRKLLLSNPKVTNKKRFLEKELEKLLNGYKKNKFDAELIINNLQNAINNEKKYCESLPELKINLGCNIGLFISNLIKHT